METQATPRLESAINRSISRSINKRATFWVAFFVFVIHKYILLGLILANINEIFGKNGLAELTRRFSAYDANIYGRISELGYNYWQLFSTRPIEFSFLPGWPWLLRLLQFVVKITTQVNNVEATSLILNQLLILPLIYFFIKFCRKLGFSLTKSTAVCFLFLFYPASVFFSFGYNETLYLAGLLACSYLWATGKKSLAVAVAVPFTLVRLNIVFVILGLVVFELGKHFQAYNLNLAIQNFGYNTRLAKIWIFSKRKWLIFWLIVLPVPLIMWFSWQYLNYGDIRYFTTQKLYFNRENLGPKGIYYALLDGLQVLQNTPGTIFNPKTKGLFSLPLLLGGLLLAALFGIQRFFEKSSKIWLWLGAIFWTFWASIFAYKHSPQWNNQLIADLFINILPIYLLIVAIYALLKSPKLRPWLLPTIFCLYLPLSSGTFASMNRYIIQSPILFIAFFDSQLLKNKPFYLFILIGFLAGYALLLHRFTHFQWAG